MDLIPVAGPWVTEKEVRYTADAAANGWYANHGVYPDRFEKGFAEYLGVTHATSLPSCTSALHLALAGLGIGSGDEVIVPGRDLDRHFGADIICRRHAGFRRYRQRVLVSRCRRV